MRLTSGQNLVHNQQRKFSLFFMKNPLFFLFQMPLVDVGGWSNEILWKRNNHAVSILLPL